MRNIITRVRSVFCNSSLKQKNVYAKIQHYSRKHNRTIYNKRINCNKKWLGEFDCLWQKLNN